MEPLDLRPRAIGEILDAAFKLTFRNLRPLIAIAAVVLVPIGLVQLAVSSTLGNVDLIDTFLVVDDQVPPGLGRFLGASLLVGLLGGIGGLLVQGASVKVFADAYQGEVGSWRESLAFGARKGLLVLAVALLSGIGAGIGLLLCIAPGVWLWTAWYVAVPALLVEDLGPVAALRRSFGLVVRRFWHVLGVGVLAWLLTLVVDQIVAFVVNLAVVVPAALTVAEGGDPTSGPLVAAGSIAGTVVSLFTVPFLAAVAVSVYFDLRVRSEGFDLELLARDLEGDAADSHLPPAADEVRDGSDRPDDPFGLGLG